MGARGQLAPLTIAGGVQKLHPPTQRRRLPVGGPPGPVSIGEDLETCEAVRDAVGDDYGLMLDSAWAYSYKEALDVGFAIEDFGYHWYEDPLFCQYFAHSPSCA